MKFRGDIEGLRALAIVPVVIFHAWPFDDRRVTQLTGFSCPPALDFEVPTRSRCAALNRELLARIEGDVSVDTVLLVARYELYLDGVIGSGPEAFVTGLTRSVQRLRAAGKRVLLLDPVPTYHYPVPAALALRWRRGEGPEEQGQSRLQYEAHQAPALALLQRLAADSGAQRIRVGELLCAPPRCAVLDGDHSLYFDDNHLSMRGAARLVPAVQRLLEAPSAGPAGTGSP